MTYSQSFPGNIVGWFDSYGKLAWIGLMVLAFVLFWPIGLALLFFLLGSGRLSNGKLPLRYQYVSRKTGNTAFDKYKAETIQQLETEREEFLAFMQRLRDARDQEEFDQFMKERGKGTPHNG